MNSVGKRGLAPVYYARDLGHKAILELLLERGAGDALDRPRRIPHGPSSV